MVEATNFSSIFISPRADSGDFFVESKTAVWHPGIKIASNEDALNTLPGFVQFVAEAYKEELDHALESQWPSRSENWPKLSEDYLQYKKAHNMDTRMWIRTNQLKESIIAHWFEPTKTWHVGIDPKTRFREVIEQDNGYRLGGKTSLKILQVARILEFGNSKVNIPARPLFRPVQQRMGKNIRDWWDEYQNNPVEADQMNRIPDNYEEQMIEKHGENWVNSILTPTP